MSRRSSKNNNAPSPFFPNTQLPPSAPPSHPRSSSVNARNRGLKHAPFKGHKNTDGASSQLPHPYYASVPAGSQEGGRNSQRGSRKLTPLALESHEQRQSFHKIQQQEGGFQEYGEEMENQASEAAGEENCAAQQQHHQNQNSIHQRESRSSQHSHSHSLNLSQRNSSPGIGLSAAKRARKQVEQQMQMLLNRIHLVRMEESRTIRRIELTKRRASQILGARREKSEKQQIRSKVQEMRERENLLIRHQVQSSRNQWFLSREEKLNSARLMKKEQANQVRSHRIQNQSLLQSNLDESIEQKHENFINRQREREMAQLRRQILQEKRNEESRLSHARAIAEQDMKREHEARRLMKIREQEKDAVQSLSMKYKMQKHAVKLLASVQSH